MPKHRISIINSPFLCACVDDESSSLLHRFSDDDGFSLKTVSQLAIQGASIVCKNPKRSLYHYSNMKISLSLSAFLAFANNGLISAQHVRGSSVAMEEREQHHQHHHHQQQQQYSRQEHRQLGYYDWYSFGCDRTMEARLEDPAGATKVEGKVTFYCSDDWYYNSHMTQIDYLITGLAPGLHGLHVHEARIGNDGGEMTCGSTGGHYNPDGMNHGSNLDWQRHIGDMANILADENGVAEGSLLAYIPLKGEYGITGTAVVIHAGQDDLGLGGNNDSRANGNAGAREACGDVRNIKWHEK